MLSQRSLENIIPQELSLADTLHRLAEELNRCSSTLRETHELVSPELEEIEQQQTGKAVTPGRLKQPDLIREAPRDPSQALSLRSLDSHDDQRSLGRAPRRSSA